MSIEMAKAQAAALNDILERLGASVQDPLTCDDLWVVACRLGVDAGELVRLAEVEARSRLATVQD